MDRKPKTFALKMGGFVTRRYRNKRIGNVTGKKSLIDCLENGTAVILPTAVD